MRTHILLIRQFTIVVGADAQDRVNKVSCKYIYNISNFYCPNMVHRAGSLLCPIILEKLPNGLTLIISRNNNENNWNFTKILDLINVELKAR